MEIIYWKHNKGVEWLVMPSCALILSCGSMGHSKGVGHNALIKLILRDDSIGTLAFDHWVSHTWTLVGGLSWCYFEMRSAGAISKFISRFVPTSQFQWLPDQYSWENLGIWLHVDLKEGFLNVFLFQILVDQTSCVSSMRSRFEFHKVIELSSRMVWTRGLNLRWGR